MGFKVGDRVRWKALLAVNGKPQYHVITEVSVEPRYRIGVGMWVAESDMEPAPAHCAPGPDGTRCDAYSMRSVHHAWWTFCPDYGGMLREG